MVKSERCRLVNQQSEASVEQRRKDLKAFLVVRRRRLEAEVVGYRGRPRVREGLSQGEIAELAGVSLNWYELFESGRGDRRVSVDFVQRIAIALRLDFDERLELFRLALPEAQALDEMRERTEKTALSVLRAIPGMLRRVIVVSSLDDMVTIAADSMHAALKPDYATIATIQTDGTLMGFAIGPRVQTICNSVHRMFWDLHADLADGDVGIVESEPRPEVLPRSEHNVQIVAVADEHRSVLKSLKWTTDQYSEEENEWAACSSLAVAIREGDALRALLGGFWSTPRKFSRIELETARVIAAIVRVVL